MEQQLVVNTKLIWDPLQRLDLELIAPKVDYVGSYVGFIQFIKKELQKNLDTHRNNICNLKKGVVIQDLIQFLTCINNSKNVIVLDLNICTETLGLHLKEDKVDDKDLSNGVQDILNHNEQQLYIINQPQAFRDYYKEVLQTYKKVTFFDHFNSFKYIVTKELKMEFEHIVYRYFSGLLEVTAFREQFLILENQLKPQQLIKFQPVKDFILSERAEILLMLIQEKDQETLKNSLDTYSLDYFDVNYLKAYLRDFGKTKEEKSKPKDRVQEIRLE